MSGSQLAVGDDPTQKLRWGVYFILIALAVGSMTGRLLAVNSENRADSEHKFIQLRMRSLEERLRAQGLVEDAVQERLSAERPQIEAEEARQFPFLSSNDRSRWLAIRALVDHGTYEIDEIVDRKRWNSIDMVQHRGSDGELHLYSSKPPLLYTIIAGEYWLLQKLTGWTLEEKPYHVGRAILLTVNILPFALMMYLLAKLVDRFGQTDWGRIFVMACACLGTMLTTFAVVMNNHTIGAVSTAIALYAFVQIWFAENENEGNHRIRWYALCGLAAAFTATNELPALSFFALAGLALFFKDRLAWFKGFLPAAVVVVVAFFATNYVAHNSLRPPYMHRSDTDPEDNWYAYTYTVEGKQIESYWQNPKGVDIGEPSKATYAFHALVGHHGIFSLTPVWLMTLTGLAIWLTGGTLQQKQMAAGIAALSLICLVFYLGLRPQEDRNYGGMTSGFRWMFWFAPLWLVAMVPAADRLSVSRWGRALACLLLALSVLSASYPTWNPWSRPWIEVWLNS
ncbi:hypothetical protein [Adhaeretor mobilis]|uniref:Glycosyltransferase RgtA/B/C/D-like domain-containing protein n=1 Tax=Adhaeretor mobilis TaxID=1930276 RepID=A0A517MVM3_9BACT|nr:hypothetical protein [Adhaeretor mobilis]QDS98932.1 hypothetical protein HG15A2_22200 [Adhaeretor mobilis]